MKENEKFTKEMSGLGKRLGIDLVSLKKCRVVSKKLKQQILPKNPKFLFQENKNKKNKKRICYKPFEHSVICWDGSVFPCCDTLEKKFCMGNALKSSFTSVWDGKKYKEFRKKATSDSNSILICKRCPNKTTHNKTHDIIE